MSWQVFTTILIARAFGATAQMDAYTLAISIPESLQYVLMLATLSIVFTPMFIEARAQHGESAAWSMALSLLGWVLGAVMIALPLLAWAMPWLMAWLAPGFAPDTRALAVELARLILPSLFYYATAGLLLGICFAYRDFATAALNTFLVALLNLGAFFIFVLWWEQGVRGMMFGRLLVLLILEVFLLARTLRWKRVTAKIALRQPRVWNLMTYLPPYMFGALSGQLELIVNRALISTLGAGSVAAWGYGQRLAEIPLAVLGGAIGATYLPDFATQVAQDQHTQASAQWNRAALRVTLWLAPIAALLATLGAPLIALLFQRGAFDAAATQRSAFVLAGLALGLPWRGVGGLIARGLPAFKSRRLPLLLSAIASGVSIALAFALLGVWGVFGVALAASLGDLVFAGVGAREFWRRLRATDARATRQEFFKILLAAALAGGGSLGCALWLQTMITNNEIALWLLQTLSGGLMGLALFCAAGFLLRVASLRAAWRHIAARAPFC